jgi:hypothetical protein
MDQGVKLSGVRALGSFVAVLLALAAAAQPAAATKHRSDRIRSAAPTFAQQPH